MTRVISGYSNYFFRIELTIATKDNKTAITDSMGYHQQIAFAGGTPLIKISSFL